MDTEPLLAGGESPGEIGTVATVPLLSIDGAPGDMGTVASVGDAGSDWRALSICLTLTKRSRGWNRIALSSTIPRFE